MHAKMVGVERSATSAIRADLERKIVLVAGPRQSGKTTIARSLTRDTDCFNYDAAEDRLAIARKWWRRDAELVVFDELHKMRGWKRWLKGVYDTQGVRPRILVTGSARLDLTRRTGDSLAGRFFQHRLYPFDVKEVRAEVPPEEALARMLRIGSFPEPFLEGSDTFYKRWRRSHLDIILRQDLIDLENVRDIQAIETLIELLRRSVGAPMSYASLGRDLERDASTVKRWLTLLEHLFVVFRVSPFHRNVARGLLKQPKYYFYDVGQVEGNDGAKLENAVALALLKDLHRLEDTKGLRGALGYVRTKEKREVDFLVELERVPRWLVEVKWSDGEPSPALSYFARQFSGVRAVQLVGQLDRPRDFPDGPVVRSAADWLATLDLEAA